MIELRPITAEDRPLLAGWMSEPHAAPWWAISELDDPALAHLHRCLACEAGEPHGYVETYLVADDPLGATPFAQDGDRGFHVLVPAERVGTGVAQRLVRLVIGRLLGEPGAARVLCEPDARNGRMIAFCRGLGGEELGVCDLADKRAVVLAWNVESLRDSIGSSLREFPAWREPRR